MSTVCDTDADNWVSWRNFVLKGGGDREARKFKYLLLLDGKMSNSAEYSYADVQASKGIQYETYIRRVWRRIVLPIYHQHIY